MHLRNRHCDRYDFKQLIQSCGELGRFVSVNAYGIESIDFANPQAVKTLNKALLKSFYNIDWDIPNHYLCPPIPGRADYVHYLADLLKEINPDKAFEGNQGSATRVLDVGVGANCIYPLIGSREYGWSFVGTEIDPKAIDIAEGIITANNLNKTIEIRLQKSPSNIFVGVVKDDEVFDISMCNPPFHASKAEAIAGTSRKWKNLGIKTKDLNFGGQNNELFCDGGEVAFIKTMIKESKNTHCKWFTTLVSKESHLPIIYSALNKEKPKNVKTIDMGQGQKKSRIVAWTFQS